MTLGIPRDSGIFGWDNEYESFGVDVPAFAIDQFQVTNEQYLEFVNAGGYTTRRILGRRKSRLGLESAHQISHPAFWRR